MKRPKIIKRYGKHFYSQAHYDWWIRNVKYRDWFSMMHLNGLRQRRERWGRQFYGPDRIGYMPDEAWEERDAAAKIGNAWKRAKQKRLARLTRRYESALDWVLKGYPG